MAGVSASLAGVAITARHNDVYNPAATNGNYHNAADPTWVLR